MENRHVTINSKVYSQTPAERFWSLGGAKLAHAGQTGVLNAKDSKSLVVPTFKERYPLDQEGQSGYLSSASG